MILYILIIKWYAKKEAKKWMRYVIDKYPESVKEYDKLIYWR